MSLRSKMLAMSTIPVVVLILAVVYSISAQRAASRANAEVDRANTVRQSLTEIQDDLGVAESSVRGYLLTERAAMQTDYEAAVAELRRDVGALRFLPAEETQRKRLERLHELVDERIATLSATLRAGTAGTRDHDRLVTSLLHGQTIADALRGLTDQMLLTADGLVADRIDTRDAAFQRSFLIQVVAMPAALVAAMILMVGFTAGIVRRVGKIRHNAKRLDEGKHLDEARLIS